MSDKYTGVVLEVDADAKVPEKELEAILTAYPSAWGMAVALDMPDGSKQLKIAQELLPENATAKEMQELKDQYKSLPEMLEYYGKFPADADQKSCQPFICLSGEKDEPKLVCFIEGDYDDWRDKEPNEKISPERVCFDQCVKPLIDQMNELCDGDVKKIVANLGKGAALKILLNAYTSEGRGVIYFLDDEGGVLIVESPENKARMDKEWGSSSNTIPEVQNVTDTTMEEAIPERHLSLKEKRALRQQGGTALGVHTTNTQASSLNKPNEQKTSESSKRVEETVKSLKDSTIASRPKSPFMIKLPQTVKGLEEAKLWWRTNFNTVPNDHKIRNAEGSWLPNYECSLPYEKLVQSSSYRDRFHSDGTPKSTSKGFSAVDAIAIRKSVPSTPNKEAGDKAGSPTTEAPVPVIEPKIRDKVIERIKLVDTKSREIMSNDEIKSLEDKYSSFYAQMGGISVEETLRWPIDFIWEMCKEEPMFAYVWLLALRIHQIKTWKKSGESVKEEKEETVIPVGKKQLSLKEKRALRKAS